MINHTNKSMKPNIKKEFAKWWTEEYGCSACDYGVCRVRYQKAIWKWFSKVLDKSVEEAYKEGLKQGNRLEVKKLNKSYQKGCERGKLITEAMYKANKDYGKTFQMLSCEDLIEEARKGERENTIKMLKRLKLETEVCVCECGKPWKGTDLDILIGEYIDTLKNTQTK